MMVYKLIKQGDTMKMKTLVMMTMAMKMIWLSSDV